MLQIAQSVGANLDQKTVVTKSLSTTRFISSTLESYLAISKCFQQYITAMYDYGGMRHNTKEASSEDEFMVVAQDFIDLLLVIDILSTLVSLMIRSQDLQQPCRKIVSNTEKLLAILEEMLRNLQEVINPENSFNLNETLWPNAAPHIENILSTRYSKSITLV